MKEGKYIMKKQIVAGLLAASMMAGCGAVADVGGEHSDPGPSRSVSARNVTADAPEIEVETGNTGDEQIASMSASSLELLQKIAEAEGTGSNVLISPTSMMMAFGMLENGANGETLTQIENTFGSIPVSEMNPIMYSMAQRFNASDDVKWNVANSIWFKDDGLVEIIPDFATAVKNYYGADILMAPFDDSTLDDINGWVNDQTYGMIPGILDQIPEDARMYLINAMAFEGEWMKEYDESDIIEGQYFRNYDNSTTKVTMLFSREDNYFEIAGGTGFIRPYKGGEYSFVGILPGEETSVEDFIVELAANGDQFAESIRNPRYSYENVIVRMPEFESEYFVEAGSVLREMGMELPFDPFNADLTGMVRPIEIADYNAYIGRVLHKTYIKVDREGTRAAAVTAIETLECTSALEPEDVVYVTLDRPFVYGIVDNATGLPVFLGTVNQL
ncbi:MAG: serpin family protein [Lachnospiraceae bacterium]|nr:serpin family protein [Lachnospiraceae bacterium]